MRSQTRSTYTDWIISVDKGGGERGGHTVAEGRPGEVAESDNSHTAKFLRTLLEINLNSLTLLRKGQEQISN